MLKKLMFWIDTTFGSVFFALLVVLGLIVLVMEFANG